MLTLTKWLYLVALIVWLGEIVFFSFVGAPAIFRTFPAPEAGRAVGAIFPIYYRIGYACGTLLLIGSVIFTRMSVGRAWWTVNTLLAAAMLAATLYAGLVVLPQAAVLRPHIHEPTVAPAIKEEFHRLHRLAVNLNGFVLVCGLAVSVITAVKLRP